MTAKTPKLKYILALALLGLPVAATANPVTMRCEGSRTSPNPSTGVMSTQAVVFELKVDAASRRVLVNGETKVVRELSDKRIIFSDYNPGILGALANNRVVTINRATGAWRDKWGSGSCKAV